MMQRTIPDPRDPKKEWSFHDGKLCWRFLPTEGYPRPSGWQYDGRVTPEHIEIGYKLLHHDAPAALDRALTASLERVWNALMAAGFAPDHDAGVLIANLAAQRDTAVETLADREQYYQQTKNNALEFRSWKSLVCTVLRLKCGTTIEQAERLLAPWMNYPFDAERVAKLLNIPDDPDHPMTLPDIQAVVDRWKQDADTLSSIREALR